ncbi:MAG: type III-B CRISPR module-associated protein Cmr5 [Leptospiraceae bacterium]|nr:type III-B CRISPR module-associated protein Cmr5 [Leptospiraceae bacterium]MCP5503237.1 type III-B CRISPR module-associated protein Cmr5 [Leptospiraceae bacterium]
MISEDDKKKGLKGIEQGRADYAYRCVEDAKRDLKEDADKYKSYCKKIPMMLKINGLGNTIGFIKAKKEKAYGILYKQVSEYLYNEKKCIYPFDTEQELLKQIIQLDTPEYRAITHELLALFSWMKRFSEGLIKGKEDKQEKDHAEG